jgi:hypothetical protein
VNRPCFLIFLLYGSLLAVAPGYAQTETPAPSEQPADSAPVAESDAAETETGQTTAPDNGDNPFDYEASEQISEDLSVSFPVDI